MPHDEKKLQVEGQNPGERVEHESFSPVPATTKKSDGSLLIYTAVAISVALIVRFFVAAPYLVDGPSMEETFHNHDYLIIDRLTYRFGEPQRGDVIVFNSPASKGNTLIKRVIGLPGDTVTVSDTGVMIANADNPKGFVLSESYITPENLGGASGQTVTLAPDHYFVMGDNRAVSSDSRSWGTLPGSNIVGRVMLRLYPFSDMRLLPGEARY